MSIDDVRRFEAQFQVGGQILPAWRAAWNYKGIDQGFLKFLQGVLQAIDPKKEVFLGDATAYLIRQEQGRDTTVLEARWEDYRVHLANLSQPPTPIPDWQGEEFDPQSPAAIEGRRKIGEMIKQLKQGVKMPGATNSCQGYYHYHPRPHCCQLFDWQIPQGDDPGEKCPEWASTKYLTAIGGLFGQGKLFAAQRLRILTSQPETDEAKQLLDFLLNRYPRRDRPELAPQILASAQALWRLRQGKRPKPRKPSPSSGAYRPRPIP